MKRIVLALLGALAFCMYGLWAEIQRIRGGGFAELVSRSAAPAKRGPEPLASTATIQATTTSMMLEKVKPAWLKNYPKIRKTAGVLSKKKAGDVRHIDLKRTRDDELYIAIADYFWGQSDGIVLEMGGLDGESYSVSRPFIQLGWQRMLVEASPQYWAKAVRKSPDAIYVGAAICNTGNVHYVETDKDPTANGILEFMSLGFLSRFYNNVLDAITAQGALANGSVTWSHLNFGEIAARKGISLTAVPCVQLHDVFATLHITHINFFVLDVEGAELAVLESIDFERVRFDVICIETMAGKVSQTAMRPIGYVDKVKEFMISKGYAFDFQKSRNSWFRWRDFIPRRKTAPVPADHD